MKESLKILREIKELEKSLKKQNADVPLYRVSIENKIISEPIISLQEL